MIIFKFPHIPNFIIKVLVFISLIFNLGNSVYAQNMPVPENIQAALLPKVLKFNPTLSQTTKIKMLVVYDSNSQSAKDEFIKGLGSSMEIRAISPIELEKYISGYDLVYFMPGINNQSTVCKVHKVLSVTGISQYVEQGHMSLGFGIQNNKPKILVNLTSLEQEGQSFSSDILRIAKIFK